MPNNHKNKLSAFILILAIFMFTLAYASVPLYQIFCQLTGYGGIPAIQELNSSLISDNILTIKFEATVDPNLPWTFKPVYTEMDVRIGEPALTFYRASNQSDKTITGIATYNIIPVECSSFFNKIQCFCFDEQSLEAGETIDMPVLFYIDADILDDIQASEVKQITLSYTFFNTTDLKS